MTDRLLVALHGHGDDPSAFSTAVAPLAEAAARTLVVPPGPVHSAGGRAWFPSLPDDDGPALAPTLAITVERKAGDQFERVISHRLGQKPPRLDDPDAVPDAALEPAGTTYGIPDDEIPF